MPTRYLKPGICDSDSIDRCSALAETLFYRLLVNVDDYGRLDARSVVIKSRCFPLKESMTSVQIEPLLDELCKNNLIHLYTTVNGCRYLQFCKWDNVPRSKISKFPAFDETCAQVYANVCNGNTNLPVTVTVTVTETGTETETRQKEKPKKTIPAALLAALGVGEKIASDWITLRKQKKAAITETAINGIVKEAAKAGYSLETALRVCCERGWAGFNADWVLNGGSAKKMPLPDNFESINYGKGVQDL